MSRSSSTYVSPNLGPTTPWAQQTSTGVFRPPPPTLSLEAAAVPSSHASLSHASTAAVVTAGSVHAPTIDDKIETAYSTPVGLYNGSVAASGGALYGSSQVDASATRSTSDVTSIVHAAPHLSFLASKELHAVTAVTSVGTTRGHGIFLRPRETAAPASAPATASSAALPPPPPPLPSTSVVEQLMRLIAYGVHTEQDFFLAQRESSRVLERELERQQLQCRDAQRQLERVEKAIAALQEVHKEQEQLLAELNTGS